MRPKSRLPRATTGLALLVGLSLTSRAWAAGHEHDRDDADEHGRHYYSEHGRDYMRNWYHTVTATISCRPACRKANDSRRDSRSSCECEERCPLDCGRR